MRFGILMKGSLNAALSEQQTHRENCLIWTVTRDGWKIHQGPTWQGCALKIRSENMAKKQSHHSVTDIGLDPRTWFFSRCSSVKKSREPESKGSFKAIQSLRFGSSAVLGGHGVRDSKIKKPLLRMHEPPLCFISSYTGTHDGSQTSPVHRAKKSTRAEHRPGVICKLAKKINGAQSKLFKLELFLEEGKKFQIMRKRVKSAHIRTDNEHINSLWRGGFWLQILKHSGSFVGTGDLISGGYQLPGSRPTACNSSSVGVARSTAGARRSSVITTLHPSLYPAT